MKKFLTRIAIFCIVFFIVEKIFYIFLIISPSLEGDNRLEKVILGEMDKELIVMGSSRGAHNIIAGLIEDSLKISSYNLSYPGSNIEFHEFLLRSLLKFNKAPKIVLLVIDEPAELLPDKTINFRLDRLYPLAKYSYINNEMIQRGEKNFISRFLLLLRINKSNFNIGKRRFTVLDTIRDNGSMPISFQSDKEDLSFNSFSPGYQSINELPNKVEAFLKFQKQCISNNIKLYLIFPPNFSVHNPSFEYRIRQLADPAVSFYVNDTGNPIYQNSSYYYDKSHLLNNGAIIFTNEIIHKLKDDNEMK